MFIVPFHPGQDQLLLLDFTAANTDLTGNIINDTGLFAQYINNKLIAANARYGIGGYAEHRTVYSRSNVFDTGGEPRRLHLGIDIWGEAGTPVSAPLAGEVHSFASNDSYGDYGATILLKHENGHRTFHTLYGHLSAKDLVGLYEGQPVQKGQTIAHFGRREENGQWPPHLHFQMIIDMEGAKGDYPGVCKYSEREKYLRNCPDPDQLIGLMQYAKPGHPDIR